MGVAQVNPGVANSGGGLGYSQPTIKTKRINTIEVVGSEKVDKQALILISGLMTGQDITIPSEAISRAIKQLWEQGLFSDIQILKKNETDENIDLVIQVKERTRLSRFNFIGIRKTAVDDLREDIDLYKEKIITEDLIVNTKNKIRGYYKDKGYYNVDVSIKQYPDTLFKNHDILAITINKNAKIKIDEIVIEGNEILSDNKIKKQLKETKRRSVFDPFYGFIPFVKNSIFKKDSTTFSTDLSNYYNERVNISIFKQSKYLSSNFKGDKEALITKYNAMGYRDAKVVSHHH